MAERIYFLGIGGSLMGNLALLALEAGYAVTGSDNKIYPPMSDILATAGIQVYEGFSEDQLDPPPQTVVIGNANLPRGHAGIEYILKEELPYLSGAEWLGTQILPGPHVMAVAGTHGKSTTSALLTWILEFAGKQPGFLMGGVTKNFDVAARLGSGDYFVVEADEYDTSYFDRRAKFMHYRPRTLLINNLEFDHADIYDNLDAIVYQFHHLIRTVPEDGRIIVPWGDLDIDELLVQGCWSPVSYTMVEPSERQLERSAKIEEDLWIANKLNSDGSKFAVSYNHEKVGEVEWSMFGDHNVSNALQAIAGSQEAGVELEQSLAALSTFQGLKRRMELIAKAGNLHVYDDFAHHPTAIQTTLNGLRDRVGPDVEVIAVIEPRSHTMQRGDHEEALRTSCGSADKVYWYKSGQVAMDLVKLSDSNLIESEVMDDIDPLVDRICEQPDLPRHVVLMSNGGFDGIYDRVRTRLA